VPNDTHEQPYHPYRLLRASRVCGRCGKDDVELPIRMWRGNCPPQAEG